jgi:hypothetical protein
MRDADALEACAAQARLERFDVHGDVRQLRHVRCATVLALQHAQQRVGILRKLVTGRIALTVYAIR